MIQRKNLLGICKALVHLKDQVNIPLVVIGDGGKYKAEVKQFTRENRLEEQVLFLSESEKAKTSAGFRTAEDFPAIYQQASAMIYPSYFEGFGIPVLEALWSRLPVITSNVSSLPEAAGPGAYYVNPDRPEEIASGIKKILQDSVFKSFIIEKGFEYAQNFSVAKTTAAVMKVYKSVW
jgi:glycosyltransferase involved in cell wall biosynthesis